MHSEISNNCTWVASLKSTFRSTWSCSWTGKFPSLTILRLIVCNVTAYLTLRTPTAGQCILAGLFCFRSESVVNVKLGHFVEQIKTARRAWLKRQRWTNCWTGSSSTETAGGIYSRCYWRTAWRRQSPRWHSSSTSWCRRLAARIRRLPPKILASACQKADLIMVSIFDKNYHQTVHSAL